jgi:tRNA A-37 threonylcarbamoyl transferase component Bud32
MPRGLRLANGATRERVLRAIESGPGRVPWDGRSDAFVKTRRRRAGITGALDAALRASRAARAFEAALVLARAGVATAEPLACLDERGRSSFVARFVEPRRELAFDRDGADAARLATKIHEAGVVHGDFKPANIVVGPRGLVVVDLDAAKVTKGVPARRARARDLGALVAYASRLGVSDTRSLVDAYLAAAEFEEDAESFARAVEARSRLKLERWAHAR